MNTWLALTFALLVGLAGYRIGRYRQVRTASNRNWMIGSLVAAAFAVSVVLPV